VAAGFQSSREPDQERAYQLRTEVAPDCPPTEVPGGIPGAHRWRTDAPQIGPLCHAAVYFSGRADTSRRSARSLSPGLQREASNYLAAEEPSDCTIGPRGSRSGITRRTAADPECTGAILLDSPSQ